jgi:hypothetical protein
MKQILNRLVSKRSFYKRKAKHGAELLLMPTLLWSQNKKSHPQTTRHIYVTDIPVAHYAVIKTIKYTNWQPEPI